MIIGLYLVRLMVFELKILVKGEREKKGKRKREDEGEGKEMAGTQWKLKVFMKRKLSFRYLNELDPKITKNCNLELFHI